MHQSTFRIMDFRQISLFDQNFIKICCKSDTDCIQSTQINNIPIPPRLENPEKFKIDYKLSEAAIGVQEMLNEILHVRDDVKLRVTTKFISSTYTHLHDFGPEQFLTYHIGASAETTIY